LVAVLLAACGRKTVSDIAEPAPVPSYGEEAENQEVFLDSMEVGSRELYAAREAVVAASKIGRGSRIADIGAGTGLYTLLFAQAIGQDGLVYAVDIEPRFLKLINQRAADLDVGNVVSVLGRDRDITVPHHSVDVVFIADTYHYFTDRQAIMATVKDALVPGGRLIVLDYHLSKENADSSKLDHVRFGKAGVISEIESFGFRLVEEPTVEGLSDFYMVVFEKTADAAPTPAQSR
jgi:ubiquinone/menaquinone biosynthesis C-methylase UbiE